MRDILFRGKSKRTGEWVEGSLVQGVARYDKELVFFIYSLETEIDGRGSIDNYYGDVVESETLGQYTGLLDKNGNKIFEGDIVKFSSGGDIRTVIFDEQYAEFEFNPKDPIANPDGVCLCVDHDACEIIGNIYDNPELIDGTPHLLEITTSRDQAKGVRVFMKGFVPDEVLTDEEMEILEQSDQYLKEQENT